MVKAVLKIPNMSCKHCVMKINKAIQSVGAKGEVSLEKKTAIVEFDPRKGESRRCHQRNKALRL